MTLGASWSGQLIYTLVSFAFGLCGGLVSRLYFMKKINKIERALVDFFTTIVLALLYLVVVQIGGKGQITFYSAVSFLLGVVSMNLILRKILYALSSRRTSGKFFKK